MFLLGLIVGLILGGCVATGLLCLCVSARGANEEDA